MSKGMATSGGLAAGIARGLAGAFGGFTVFMIMLIMALIGAVLGAGAAIFMDGRSGFWWLRRRWSLADRDAR